MRHGGQILVDHLTAFGVSRVFCVPGESFLAALDGLYENGIETVVCRHEGGAAMMAEAQGKMTGAPGVAFVTRGPGACNASAGVHVARQDSTPMVLFVGQIATGDRDREAFQEVDYRAMFGPLAKWVAEVDETERLPEYVARAFRVAVAGRPGPVVLALPEDVLSGMAEVPDRAVPPPDAEVGLEAAAERIAGRLAKAERPMIVAGGPLWSAQAAANLAAFAEAWQLPVAVGFRRQDYIDNRHPCYVGDLNVGVNPRLAARMKEADLLLVLGSRLGDIETGGYLRPAPGKAPAVIHIHAGAEEIGRVYPAEMALVARAEPALRALVQVAPRRSWEAWRAAARADYEAWIAPQETPGDLKLENVISWLSDHLPEDAILTNGAGNYAAWLHRYFVYKRFGTQLAPTSGSMGFGFPAAIAASLEYPEKTVVCLAGDGCFQMTLNEASTAVQYGASVIVLVVNNGRYGTIRMHQEKTYPGRVSGTDLANPDFAALARAYGGAGWSVTRDADFADAFREAEAAEGLRVIELQVDAEALSTGQSLSAAREQALRGA
ncbi:thiamine pyrophosphate-binding protein [Aestuariibius sp. 2305UL40-4]|uniref:thiamine pyrophosphate-binding protein n=1 Tax=Aestuariibius violaceus TaxID=3234132 RepID=UPI00345E71E7